MLPLILEALECTTTNTHLHRPPHCRPAAIRADVIQTPAQPATAPNPTQPIACLALIAATTGLEFLLPGAAGQSCMMWGCGSG